MSELIIASILGAGTATFLIIMLAVVMSRMTEPDE